MIPPLPPEILDQRVIPVARRQDADTAPILAEALSSEGFTILEITVEFDSAIEAIEAAAAEGITVGAGTVTTPDEAAAAVQAGATFIVSPHLDEDLMAWASSEEVPIIPGGLTPTELHKAVELGAPAVKLFPASLGGVGYMRSLFGPFPDMRVIATGGIDAGNALDYLDAGAIAVGIGSWLTSGVARQVKDRARQLRQAIN